jgi:hypothetical protein
VGEDLEGVGPLVPQKARNAPEHAERLDGSGGDDSAAVEGLPAKLLDDARRLSFRFAAIAAYEHGGRALLKSGFTMKEFPTLLKALTTFASGILAWIFPARDSLGPVVN